MIRKSRLHSLYLTLLSLLFSSGLSANNQLELLDSNNQLNLQNAVRFSRDLNNICRQTMQGRDASNCANVCGQLSNRLQDLSTTLSRSNLPANQKQRSAKFYLDATQQCGRMWAGKQAPDQFKPFADLAQHIAKGKPVNAAGRGNTPGPSFAKTSPITKPNKPPHYLTPFLELYDLYRQANLPHQCTLLGLNRNCHQACQPVLNAALNLRNQATTDPAPELVKGRLDELHNALPACAAHLPSTNEWLVATRKITGELLTKPDVYQQWNALAKAPITPENDAITGLYPKMMAEFTEFSLRFCNDISGGCSPACVSMNDTGKLLLDLHQQNAPLEKQQHAVETIKKRLKFCRKVNLSPRLDAIDELADYLQQRPELLYGEAMRQQLAQNTDAENGNSYPLELGYTLTPLSAKVVNQFTPDISGLLTPSGHIDQLAMRKAFNSLVTQTCQGQSKECEKSCKVTASAGITLNAQNKPNALQDIKANSGINSMPHALNFLERSAKCLNYLAEHKLGNQAANQLYGFYQQIKSNQQLSEASEQNFTNYALNTEIALKLAACSAENRTDCMISCANARTVSFSAMPLLQGHLYSRTAELEGIMDGYLAACRQASLEANNISVEWMQKVEQQDFTSQLNHQAITANIKKLAEHDKQQSNSPAYSFIAKFPPEDNAPVEVIKVSDEARIKVPFKDIVDALMTIHNYCPKTGKGRLECYPLRPKEFVHHLAAFYDLEEPNRTSLESLKMMMGLVLRRSDDPIEDEKLAKVKSPYHNYKGMSPAIQPAKFKIIEQFVSEAVKMQPSLLVKQSNSYCNATGKKAGNPFIGLDNCEYLSAIYYRDFARMVTLESLWMEPILQRYDMIAKDNPLYNLLDGGTNQSLLKNIEKVTMVPMLISNYLIDYNIYYRKCLKDNAKTYSYTTTHVTELRNRWGYTMQSNSYDVTNSYQVNPEWVNTFDALNVDLNESRLGFFKLADSAFQETELARMAETKYGAKRPNLRGVLADLRTFMNGADCQSPEAQKLDKRLNEFAQFRKTLMNTDFR